MFPSSTGSFALRDIDSSISQSETTGDCWLLAGIYALAQNEKGLKILNESVYKNLLGTQVYFKGVDQMVPISELELFRAEKSCLFSQGSESYLIFELAFEKLRKDIMKRKVRFSEGTEEYLKKIPLNLFKKKICGGYAAQVFYYLTGKEPGFIDCNFNKYLDKLRDMKNVVACCAFDFPAKTYMAEGICRQQKVEVYKEHSYCLTSIGDYICTIVNPHDTSKKIAINRYEFCAILNYIEFCEL